MARRFAPIVLASFTWLAAATGAAASVIYQYVGSPYFQVNDEPIPAGTYTTDMRITARFELSETPSPGPAQDGLTVLSYAISDGRVTLDESNSSLSFTDVDVNLDGNIHHAQFVALAEPMNGVGSQWHRIVSTGESQLEFANFAECTAEPCSPEDFTGDSAFSQSTSGVGWSIVPEPSTALLVGLALVGLRGVRGMRR